MVMVASKYLLCDAVDEETRVPSHVQVDALLYAQYTRV